MTEGEKRDRDGRPLVSPLASLAEQRALADIIDLLHAAFRLDFSHYRQSTVLLRLSRRIGLSRQAGIEAYRDFLRETPAELERLYDDLLLSFTSFFRDPPVFEALKAQVFPRLVEG